MIHHPLCKDTAKKMKMIIKQKEKESGERGETCKNKESTMTNEEEGNMTINKKERNVTSNVKYSRNNEKNNKLYKKGTSILKDFDGATYRGVISERFDGTFYKISYSN